MLYTVKSFPTEFSLKEADVALLGIPFDSTETQRQTKFGPMFFRLGLNDLEGFDADARVDIFEKYKFCDMGNVDVVEGSWELTDERINDSIKSMLKENPGIFPIFIGGDHSITLSILKSLQNILNKKITVIQFDAHPDLYKEWKGYKFSHACWAYPIHNDKNFELIQVGTRCVNKEEYNIWKGIGKAISETNNPVYITIDLDVLDPAHAKSVATPEPLGLTLQELYSQLNEACKNKIIGFDIVECASRSVDDDSHMTACNIMKKILVNLWQKGK